ncbi:hypothetical protein MITS9509_02668 [Synechococcus sp. MIT S9509]|nr:hypothetical protein MITS9509_02668 [Synechococcus sp. MIT S9509]
MLSSDQCTSSWQQKEKAPLGSAALDIGRATELPLARMLGVTSENGSGCCIRRAAASCAEHTQPPMPARGMIYGAAGKQHHGELLRRGACVDE